jgi:hypothetical protein
MTYIAFAIYMFIGFWFIKPKEIKDIHLTWIDFSDGFFLFDIPIWLWIIIWIFWLPIKIIQWVLVGFN